MFEVGFTEIVLILGLALLVLGPEKLPGLAEKVGRWTGRARAMARQLRTQLEHEVTLEEMAKSRPMQPPPHRRLRRRTDSCPTSRRRDTRRTAAAAGPEPRSRRDRSSGIETGPADADVRHGRRRRSPPRRQPTHAAARSPRHERDEEREQLAEGTLISHLVELRDRLLRAVIAIAIVLHSLRVLLRTSCSRSSRRR